MERNGSVRGNVALSSAWQVVQLAAPLITAPYVSRVLTPGGIGIFSYTKSVQMYFSLVAVLGTSAYGSREMARLRENPVEQSQSFWEIEALCMMTSALCIGAWALYVLLLARQHRLILLILTAYIASAMLDISWLYVGMEKFRLIIARNAVFQTLGIVLQFALVKSPEDLWKYAAVMSGTSLAGNLSMWIPLRNLVQRPSRRMRFLPHLKETVVYFVPSVATSMYTFLDKILIGALTGKTEQNGLYEQANQLITVGKQLTFASLNQVLGSRISWLYEAGKTDEIKRRIARSAQFVLCLGTAVALGLAAVSDTFVPWFFGEQYAGAAVLLKALCPLIVVIGISNLLGSQWYIPSGRRRQSARFVMAGAALNLALSLCLIPRLYAMGAVLGTCAAETAICVLYVAFCGRNLTVLQLCRYAWRPLVSGAAMFALVHALNGWSTFPLLRLAVQVGAGAVLYAAGLIVLKDPFIRSFVKKEEQPYA